LHVRLLFGVGRIHFKKGRALCGNRVMRVKSFLLPVADVFVREVSNPAVLRRPRLPYRGAPGSHSFGVLRGATAYGDVEHRH